MRPIARAISPSAPASNNALRICERCVASNCVRAALDSRAPSRERISTSTSPTVCGDMMPGAVCTLVRTRCAGAAGDVCCFAGPIASPRVDLVSRGVAQHHAKHRVIAREGFDLRRAAIRGSSRSTASDTRFGNMARDFAGAQGELAEHAIAGVRGRRIEQRRVLRAVLVHHDRPDRERHRDGGGDGDGDVLALEADDAHGIPILLICGHLTRGLPAWATSGGRHGAQCRFVPQKGAIHRPVG